MLNRFSLFQRFSLSTLDITFTLLAHSIQIALCLQGIKTAFFGYSKQIQHNYYYSLL